MTINFKHITTEPSTENGYMVAIMVQHQGKRSKKMIFRAWEHEFDAKTENVLPEHPDFDFLAPKLLDLKIKARKLLYQNYTDVKAVMRMLFEDSSMSVLEFGNNLVANLQKEAGVFDKFGDVTKRNRLLGNARVYANVLAQWEKLYPDGSFSDFNFNYLMAFRKYIEQKGNSKSTVHMYLRTMRSLYNKAQKSVGFADTKPFTDVFTGLKVRSHSAKKKWLTAADLQKLYNAWHHETAGTHFRDLFILQFCFGGCDTIDVYYLKKSQLRNGRVLFERAKTGVTVSLAVHPIAQQLIEAHQDINVKNEYIFPWRKDQPGYKTFHRQMYRRLQLLQQRENIEVRPDGSSLGGKVVRHTFANLAKQLGVDDDLLRELMGHDRDDVDNYYKDKYPEPVRDAALFKIIAQGLSIQ